MKEMTNNEYLKFLDTINELPKKQYEIIRRGVLQLNEDKKELLSIIKYLQNNRDKAIEYIEKHPCNTWYSIEKPNKDLREVKVIKHQEELLKILKGDSDEFRRN